MTQLQSNAPPLIRRRTPPRRYQGVAHVVPLKRTERAELVWPEALAFALVALGASILLGAGLAAVSRAAPDVLSRFVPGWPWF